MWHNTEVDVITISAWNETDDVQFPPLFSDSTRIKLDPSVVDAKIAEKLSDQKNKKAQETHEKIRATVVNGILSEHILARLKVPDSSNPFPKSAMSNKLPPISPRTESKMPFLVCLAADTNDVGIMVPKPSNMEEPPKWQKLKHVSPDQVSERSAGGLMKTSMRATMKLTHSIRFAPSSLGAVRSFVGGRNRGKQRHEKNHNKRGENDGPNRHQSDSVQERRERHGEEEQAERKRPEVAERVLRLYYEEAGGRSPEGAEQVTGIRDLGCRNRGEEGSSGRELNRPYRRSWKRMVGHLLIDGC